ncbi:MAG: HNH endonuclease [Anaeromyxobacter sp.]|nr:HNH endonuclease [Anaeromyxobacter sp.]
MKKRLKYVDVNGIKIEPRLFEAAVHSGGISVGFGDEVPYDENYPWLFDADGPIEPLHVATWNFFKGNLRPKKDGEVIHHIDCDKLNATISNLGIGTPRAHGLAHAAKRQKFTYRKRWHLGGLYRPQAEAEVRELGFIEELRYREQLLAREAQRAEDAAKLRAWIEAARSTSGPSSPPNPGPATPPPVRDLVAAEKVLAAALPRLRAELDHLDSGEKIPPPASRPCRRDRLLDLGRIRRGCTPGEAAVVRLLVKHHFDLDAAAGEVKVPVGLMAKMKKTTAVDLAIQSWLDCGRLPPPCSPKKLRPYADKARRAV